MNTKLNVMDSCATYSLFPACLGRYPAPTRGLRVILRPFRSPLRALTSLQVPI